MRLMVNRVVPRKLRQFLPRERDLDPFRGLLADLLEESGQSQGQTFGHFFCGDLAEPLQ